MAASTRSSKSAPKETAATTSAKSTRKAPEDHAVESSPSANVSKKQKIENSPASPPPLKAAAAAPLSPKQPSSVSSSSSVLKLGSVLPADFPVVTNDSEKAVSLFEVAKTSAIIVFFYPKANTGGCTKQAIGFQTNYQSVFKKNGIKVYGCSADGVTSLVNWKKKHGFEYELLSDKDFKIIKKLGVFKAPKNIHRSHIVIEKGTGKIIAANIGVSPGDSFEECVELVKKGDFKH